MDIQHSALTSSAHLHLSLLSRSSPIRPNFFVDLSPLCSYIMTRGRPSSSFLSCNSPIMNSLGILPSTILLTGLCQFNPFVRLMHSSCSTSNLVSHQSTHCSSTEIHLNCRLSSCYQFLIHLGIKYGSSGGLKIWVD